MKNLQSICLFFLCVLIIILSFGCKKYLDAKTNISYEIPQTAGDLQAILNKYESNTGTPIIASDDYYLDYNDWSAMFSIYDRSNYIWDASTPDGGTWNISYYYIRNFNTVLDNISTVSLGDTTASGLNRIMARALFLRACQFYYLASVYSLAYNSSTSSSYLGISLRTTASATTNFPRATLEETYNKIVSDLKTAANILPTSSTYPTIPTKQAAFAELARVYLSMSDYTNAGLYADSCLQINNVLMDYNSNPYIDTTQPYPFKIFNPETIFFSEISGSEVLLPPGARVDSFLYQSYLENDLRKNLFFTSSGEGGYNFIGSYNQQQSAYPFDGIATDEMYLTRAECKCRSNNTYQAGIDDLNALLLKRYRSGTFTPLVATSAQNALQLVLTERRKELIFRGTRFMDLKRLNLDPTFAISITRNLNGIIYTLPPNDSRYAYLLPQDVIALGGYIQNPR